MDSRVFRVIRLHCPWFDVDYPDVIDLRRQLFPERGASYHLIGAPLDELRWLDQVPRDRPGLFIAEGVLHYLSETEVKALLNAWFLTSRRSDDFRYLQFDDCKKERARTSGARVQLTSGAG